MVSRVVFENKTGEPIYYLDEWLEKIATGEIRPSTVDEIKTVQKDAGRKIVDEVEKKKGQRDTELTVLRGKIGQLDVRESELKSQVDTLLRHEIRDDLGGLKSCFTPAQKAALSTVQLRSMLAALPDRLIGTRDRALLLLGFAGAFRRSELAGLDMDDLVFCPEGLRVTLRRSKTDQEGLGRTVGIPFSIDLAMCPVRAVRAWFAAAQLTTGPLFREVSRYGHVGQARLANRVVGSVVKRAAASVGLDPATLAGHSLRAGYATSAAQAGKPVFAIQQQTGHKSVAMVSRYVRAVDLFKDVGVL